MYGIYYLMFATFPDLFTNVYHFSEGITGVCYLGLGLGFMAATIFGASFADKVYHSVRLPRTCRLEYPSLMLNPQLAAKNGGAGKPEYRIPALIFGSFFVPIGLLYVLDLLSSGFLGVNCG